MKSASLVLLAVINIFSCSQELSKEELYSREKAQEIIQSYIKDEVFQKSHLVFSTGDKQFLVLIENTDSIHEFFIDTNRNSEKAPFIHKLTYEKDSLMNRVFCVNNYHLGFIGFESEFFKDGYEFAYGNNTYFALFSVEGTRVSESKLSFFIKPNPIDSEIYLFFIQRILDNMRLD